MKTANSIMIAAMAAVAFGVLGASPSKADEHHFIRRMVEPVVVVRPVVRLPFVSVEACVPVVTAPVVVERRDWHDRDRDRDRWYDRDDHRRDRDDDRHERDSGGHRR